MRLALRKSDCLFPFQHYQDVVFGILVSWRLHSFHVSGFLVFISFPNWSSLFFQVSLTFPTLSFHISNGLL